MALTTARVLDRLGRRIAEIRRDEGLTQEQLAERLGVSRNYMQRVESGTENLTIGSVAKIANALRIADLTKLFTEPSSKRRIGRPRKGRA